MNIKVTIFLISVILNFFISDIVFAKSSINVVGSVVNSSCTISVESKNFTVNLKSHRLKNFNHTGESTLEEPFYIVLSSCGVATTKIKITFNGTTDYFDSSALKNESLSNGFAVQILDVNKKIIIPNIEQSFLEIVPAKENRLQYFARILVTKTPVTAGEVRTSSDFIIEFL